MQKVPQFHLFKKALGLPSGDSATLKKCILTGSKFNCMASKRLQSIRIDQLRIGMCVAKLDISWLDSPFLSHAKQIKSDKEIQALEDAGVQQLMIDLERGDGLSESSGDSVGGQAAPTIGDSKDSAHSKQEPLSLAQSVAKEMKAAFSIRSKVKEAVDGVFRSLETGAPVEMEDLLPLIDSTLASLERNSQALMSLVHLTRKSKKLADHTFGTFSLVLNLAAQMNLPDSEKEALGVAALLHEAGWTQLPLSLMGSRVRYNANQLTLVQKHTLLGEKLLARSELSALSRRIVNEHHELLDGSGYPKGLKGDQIHRLTQLLTVVDVYEERVHQLTDKPGMIATNALRSLYLDAEKGMLNPEVVAMFINTLGIYPVSTAVELNTGEKAVVTAVHAEAPLQPLVKIYYDAKGNLMSPPLEIDLHAPSSAGARQVKAALDPRAADVDPARRLILEEGDW